MHALADHFGRKVVLVWPDDKEVVVEPRPELRLDRLKAAATLRLQRAHSSSHHRLVGRRCPSGFVEPCQPSDTWERYASPVTALCSGSINDFAENGFVR